MTKIPEDSVLKKESYLLKTPTNKRPFRKDVRTSLSRSVKKLVRAFFSEPNLRSKSRSGIVPKKLDLREDSFAAGDIAGGVNTNLVESNTTSVVLDDNISCATAKDNTSSSAVNDTTSSDKQNLGRDQYIATKNRTLTD